MLIEVGPATLVLAGEKGGEAFPFDRLEIEAYVARILHEIGEALPILRQKAYRIKQIDYLPKPAKRMIRAVRAVDADDADAHGRGGGRGRRPRQGASLLIRGDRSSLCQ